MAGIKNPLQRMGFTPNSPVTYSSNNYSDRSAELLSHVQNSKNHCSRCGLPIVNEPKRGSAQADFDYFEQLKYLELCDRCYKRLVAEYAY